MSRSESRTRSSVDVARIRSEKLSQKDERCGDWFLSALPIPDGGVVDVAVDEQMNR